MELINWSLSALDKIFPQRKESPGEPLCPEGTFAAGYVRDAWDSWRLVCLEALSLEDVEDLFIYWTLIAGILLIGLGIALIYRRIGKTAAGRLALPLSTEIKQHLGFMDTRLTEFHQKMARIEGLISDISARSEEEQRRSDNIGRQSEHLLRSVKGLSVKLEEMSKLLHASAGDDEHRYQSD